MSSTYFHLEFLGNNNFLTLNPEITFFKFVYRTFENFAMEFIEENLVGVKNFGNILTCNLSKTGDLIYQIFLKIELPSVAISANNLNLEHIDNDYLNDYLQFQDIYNLLTNFINWTNFNIIIELKKLLLINKIDIVLSNKIDLILNNKEYYTYLQSLDINIKYDNIFFIPLNPNNSANNFIKEEINLKKYLNFKNYYDQNIKSNIIDSNILEELINKYNSLLMIIKEQTFILLEEKKKIKNKIERQFINFAWVNKIGHQIIDNIELFISGNLIDFTDSIKIDIDFQLNSDYYKNDTYNNLIGNIPELNTFNDNIKPSYILYIPINFWFTRYSNSSFPILHLKNNDITINIKLNELLNCCYFEKINDINLEDILKIKNISLIVNYIFLDLEEKKKFKNINEEYLIIQLQRQIFNINSINSNFNLLFFNPIISLFWVIRNNNNIYRLLDFEYSGNFYADIIKFEKSENCISIITDNYQLNKWLKIKDKIEIINSVYYSGNFDILEVKDNIICIKTKFIINENYLFNYNFINNKFEKKISYLGSNQAFCKKIIYNNSFSTASVQVNNENLYDNRDSLYFNFIIPYQLFKKTPQYGLNTISFNLNNNELYQPNGFCNVNNFKSFILTLNNIFSKDSTINIYAINYNFLKFKNETAELLFTI